MCLLGAVLEMSCKPVKAEIVENGGYISMDEDVDDDVNEKTPLFSDSITKVEKDESKMTMCKDKLCD